MQKGEKMKYSDSLKKAKKELEAANISDLTEKSVISLSGLCLELLDEVRDKNIIPNSFTDDIYNFVPEVISGILDDYPTSPDLGLRDIKKVMRILALTQELILALKKAGRICRRPDWSRA